MTIRRIQKTAVGICVTAVVMLVAATASAEWGEGVRGGPFVLHPGVSLSAGFDSNLFYSSPSDQDRMYQAPEGVLEPRLSIETEEGGDWDLDGNAAVRWRHLFSDDDRVRAQSGLSADLDATATWNAEGAFSLRFSEEFTRTHETPNYPSIQSINRIYNQAGIMAGLHPGGRVLETYVSYDFALHRYSERLSRLNRDAHQFGWHGHWAFLPKTALVAEADHRRIRYHHGEHGGPAISADGQMRNANSNPVRLLGGLEGLITERISVGLRGGYGWANYEVGPDHQNALARAEASYQFGNLAFDNRLRAGYDWDFSDSRLGNFYTRHRILAGYEQGFVENRLRFDLEASGEIRNYSDLEIDQVETELGEYMLPEDASDLLFNVSASTDYELRDGWTVGARYRFRANFTDDAIEVAGPDIADEQLLRDYNRHHLLLSTTLTY